MAAVLCPTLLFCSYVKSEVMIEIINFMRDYSERVNETKNNLYYIPLLIAYALKYLYMIM